MYIAIDKILELKGRTRYWLHKEIECHYGSLSNLCNNQTNSINFDLLERICTALDCTPNDIILPDDGEW